MANKLGWPPRDQGPARWEDTLPQLREPRVEPYMDGAGLERDEWPRYKALPGAALVTKDEQRLHLRITQMFARIKRLEKRVKELEGRK